MLEGKTKQDHFKRQDLKILRRFFFRTSKRMTYTSDFRGDFEALSENRLVKMQ